MKKIIALFLVLLLLPINIAQGDLPLAITYLESQTPSPWVTIALATDEQGPNIDYLKSSDGEEAIQLTAPILALTASGQDPRNFPDIDLVAKLKTFYNNNQLGNALYLNDDIFGILALVSAGENPNSQEIEATKNFLLNNQNSDGGWSWGVGSDSGADMTAGAIMALLEADTAKNDTAIIKAINFLKTTQNSDHGWGYAPGQESDTSSTAWSLMALNKLDENLSNWENPQSLLLTFQLQNGAFENKTGSGENSFTPIETAYASMALAGKYLPINVLEKENPENIVNYIIKGNQDVICAGEITSPNALQLIKDTASTCNFTYEIQDTSFGPYLKKINQDEAHDLFGWLYKVNGISLAIGAVDYELKNSDQVLWYFGEFGDEDAGKETKNSLNLRAEVLETDNVGSDNEQSDTISFILDTQNLNFGLLKPGEEKSQTVKITNNGNIDIYIEVIAQGDDIFRNYLNIDQAYWRDWSSTLAEQHAQDLNLKINLPASYDNPGQKSGELIFWAIAN